MVALKSTSFHCLIATPLHQPALHYLSKGLMGSADLRKDAEQLQPLIWRVEVDQRDDEDDRRTRPPTILREQQRSTCTTCVWVAGRTLLRLRKPGVESAATRNRPKTARRATQDQPSESMASRKLVTAIHQTPLQPHSYCATAVARPSDAIGGPDRDQPRLLCPPTRAARAALRRRTIICHAACADSQIPTSHFRMATRVKKRNPVSGQGTEQ